MYVIGLTSGTSADHVNAAICEITGAPPALNARIVQAVSFPYPDGFQARILDACLPEKSHVDTLCQLNFDIGEIFAAAALHVIQDADLTLDQIDMIGLHGQTVWNTVQASGSVSATLQIAEAALIAERTSITTISNFLSRDVAAGGQGTPLTGYIDWLLLRHSTSWRAIQNISGRGNVTFLPPLIDTASRPSVFDTGPGDALIDATASLVNDGQRTYDQSVVRARQGQIDEAWLQTLSQRYAHQSSPNSQRELFGVQMAQQLVSEGRSRGLTGDMIVATTTALTAISIADVYNRFAPAPIAEVIMGGGGARNLALLGLLQTLLPTTQVLTHEDVGIDSDHKEALVFAVLAHETWHARTGNLPTLTGAQHPVVLGHITPGSNYAELIRRTWCAMG